MVLYGPERWRKKLKALAAPAKDQSLVPDTHMVANNNL